MLTPVLIDDRISCDFLVSDTVDNVVYCSGIEESLYDINTFTTKGGEFIHQYITESSGDKSVILNVTLPDGTVLENVKFKVIVSDSIDLPYSTIRYSIDGTVNTLIQENSKESTLSRVGEDLLDKVEPVAEQVEDVPVVQDIDEDIFVERAKLLETKIINEQELVEQQKELIKQKEDMVESHRNLLNSLDYYKEQLDLQLRSLYEQNTKQFFDDKKKQFNESVKRIDEQINKLIKEKKDFDALNQQNKQYTDAQVARASKEAREFAKRILDLGGGGGSVAQQFANGGTMNGNLNVTGQYLSGGVNLATIFSQGGGGGGGGTYGPYSYGSGIGAIQPLSGSNTACGNYSNVAGGRNNTASGDFSTASGYYNTASGPNSTVVGGSFNIASGQTSIVLGGCGNTASNTYSIVTGYDNHSSGVSSLVFGTSNTASGNYISIVGGYSHTASGRYSFIGGGQGNTASGWYSFIGNGGSGCGTVASNIASGCYSTVLNGTNNTASGNYSFIGGGSCNNTCDHSNVFILGSNICATQADTTFVNNIISPVYCGAPRCGGAGGYINMSPDSQTPLAGGSNGNGGCFIAAGGYNEWGAGAGSGGYVNISGGSNVDTAEGPGGNGGSVVLVGGTSSSGNYGPFSAGNGGSIISNGNAFYQCLGQSANGGTLDMSAGFGVDGGSISTAYGGGSINTGGTGGIGLGNCYTNQQTGLIGTVSSGHNQTLCFPDTCGVGGIIALVSNIPAAAYNLVNATSSIRPVRGSNTASGCYSVVAGGRSNVASGDCSFVGGGDTNCTTNANDVVAGGNHNCATGGASFVGGGRLSTASAQYATVVGGNQNSSTGYGASVLGGYSNNASGNYSAILGGYGNNTNNQVCSFIIGQNITASQPNYTYVNNLSSQGALAGACITLSQTPTTFVNPVTASGTFLTININGVNKAIQLWNYTT